ncbi:MAG: TonB-dependent receptor [Proteobacteria bacterium]|nr:TonB-dependent receptor [Pseudomonadota bacterium]
MPNPINRRALAGASSLFAIALATPALAADEAGAPNADDIVVTATKVNKSTPITASVHTFEPQAIISRSIIEDSVPATADFSDVILLTPGASGTSNGGGPGLSESKTVLRGFQDGQFNITYDGIPFGDSNDPTHHSTAYFPDGTYERIIVDRGPGGATDLGQASYGGNVHIISREAGDKRFLEGQAAYGSYKTFLGRLTWNSGEIARLGGLKLIAVGEWKRSDTALTGSNAWFLNGFLKLEKDLGNGARLSFLTSYNQDLYHQSDSNGVSCTISASTPIKAASSDGPWPVTDGSNCNAGTQVATYGKGYGLTEFASGQFANTLWPSARRDWNWTNKTTDFEILRLQWDLSPSVTIDNKAYTYFYKNFTVSAANTSTPCGLVGGVLVATPTTCGGYSTKLAGAGLGGAGGASVASDIPGYTKVNQYRTSGDVLTLTVRTRLGTAKAGVWYENSFSHRYRYNYDFTKGFNAGAISDGNFDFAGMAQFYNYSQTNAAYNLRLDATPVPAYVNYDENTGWNQLQGFGEFQLKLFKDRLTITPGVKVQRFTRSIDTYIAAQSTRVGVRASESYTPTLPYLTANYLLRPNWSVYGQFAKGFLIPSLSNSLETVYPNVASPNGISCVPPGSTSTAACNFLPTRTTNYQFGSVFAGDRLNIDVDGYFIKSSTSTYVDPSSGIATTTGNPSEYQGVEGQISYALASGLTVIANGSLMSSKDAVTHLWLAQAPNSTATLGAVYSAGRFKLSYIHKFIGRQFADTGQLVRIAPYSMGQLAGSVRLIGNVWLGGTVYNLFDDTSTTKIGSSTGALPLYFFQPGRSYQVQLKARF